MATLTTEEQGWKEAAAAHRDESGTGLPLAEFDPDNDDDMAPVYSALKVTHPVAQKRLYQYIRRFREHALFPLDRLIYR